jgi:PleD family two-component response regulator
MFPERGVRRLWRIVRFPVGTTTTTQTAYTRSSISRRMSMEAKPKLLLIEDSVDNLEVLRVLLDQDYEVTSCTSCSLALDVMRACGYSLATDGVINGQ